ncbi:15820_t:CDS:2, partial [Acaulospora colombiana]
MEPLANQSKIPMIAITVHPSKYNGTQDPESWLQDIRFFCRLHGIEDEEDIVSFALLKVDPMIFVPEKTVSFSGLIRALKAHVTYPVMIASALNNLRQLRYNSNMEMTDFISTFLSLCRSANITNLMEQKHYLLNSLHDDNIRNILASKLRNVDEFDWVIKIFQGILYEYPLHQIRYGSRITIKHCVTGQYLSHGEHKPMKPGSQNSRVYCSGCKPKENEVWIVTSPFGENRSHGDPAYFNSFISLVHEKSRTSLSAVDKLTGRDDTNCNWLVKRHTIESGYQNDLNGAWAIGDIIILEHVNNKLSLFSRSQDYEGNQEVILEGDGYEESNKYETYKSTLAAYPETLLGTIFQDKNRSLIYATNGNEYFIDRNGCVFHYIMQFYRTGKVFWSEQNRGNTYVTYEELLEELDYFQIPVSPISSAKISGPRSHRSRILSSTLADFVNSMDKVITVITDCTDPNDLLDSSSDYSWNINISFGKHERGMFSWWATLNGKPLSFHEGNEPNFKSYKGFNWGCKILKEFGDEIGDYFEENIEGLSWKVYEGKIMSKPGNELNSDVSGISVFINITNAFDHEEIVD